MAPLDQPTSERLARPFSGRAPPFYPLRPRRVKHRPEAELLERLDNRVDAMELYDLGDKFEIVRSFNSALTIYNKIPRGY
jgi:hypothetical protein